MSRLELGPVGVALTVSGSYLDEAAEVERLGYSAIWLPGGQIDRLDRLADMLRATTTVPVASAVISLDVYPSDAVTCFYGSLEAEAAGRFVVGLGGPQKPGPLAVLNVYLDRLDRGVPPVPAGRRILAALGPRKLALARDRSAGALLLLVTPAYTAAARQVLGAEATVVVDQMLVLDTDAVRARQAARRPLRFLSGLRGYRASFARMGFADADIARLTDGFVDELVTWGAPATIAARVNQHLDAGADHVVLHVVGADDQPGPIEVARMMADSLPVAR